MSRRSPSTSRAQEPERPQPTATADPSPAQRRAFGELVARQREDRGLGPEDLAKAAGVPVETIHALESGELSRSVTARELGGLADGLEIDAFELLRWWREGPPPPPEDASPSVEHRVRFGRFLQQRRNELGLSQGDAADRVAMKRNTLGRLERGQVDTLDVAKVFDLARGLEIAPDTLVRLWCPQEPSSSLGSVDPDVQRVVLELNAAPGAERAMSAMEARLLARIDRLEQKLAALGRRTRAIHDAVVALGQPLISQAEQRLREPFEEDED